MGWKDWLAPVVGGPVGGELWTDAQNAKKMKEEMEQRTKDALAEMTPEAIQAAFQQMQGTMSPFMNAIANQATMMGQSQARGLQGGLARAGLGSTGMGAAMGAGAMTGAQMGGQTLRAKMMQDLYNESIRLQQSRAGIVGSEPIVPDYNPYAAFNQRAGDALTIYGGYKQGQPSGGASNNPVMSWTPQAPSYNQQFGDPFGNWRQ